MSHEEWQNYCLNDAKILAKQHRFGFDEFPEIPSPESLKQAAVILKRTPLQGQNFFHLLEDIFHMLWQQQYGKLRTLHAMAVKHQLPQHFQNAFLRMSLYLRHTLNLVDVNITQ